MGVDQNKLTNAVVKCLSGAKVVTLTEEAEKLPDRLVIVGGENSCSDTKVFNAVVSDFKVIINAEKCKANMITMSSVCQQSDTDVQRCIDTVNAALKCFVLTYNVPMQIHLDS